jgi:hypothetical protein
MRRPAIPHSRERDGPLAAVLWIGALRGDQADEAARQLWDRDFDRLVGLARARLRAAARMMRKMRR